MSSVLILYLSMLQTEAVTPRLDFSQRYFAIGNGNWYRGEDNSTANLAWGESYVMAGLASMARATRSPFWLDQLAWHVDAVLASRDNQLGVSDYRGVSGDCWQNLSYQPASEPYCYVAHSGMLTYPMAEYVRLVQEWGYENELAYDDIRFGDKSQSYLEAVQEVVSSHNDQWDDAGFYRARTDANFLSYAGSDLPFNMSNAMGRTLLNLYRITNDTEYLDKVTALANNFRSQITDGQWNYWGNAYTFPGEDISHAAINVDFAALCAEQGIVFTDADMKEIANTFMTNVYLNDSTFSDWVGGGSTNNPSYIPQLGRWVRLSSWRTGLYTAVRNLFDESNFGSASALAGYGLLAEFEPPHCEHFFYSVDWNDPNPNSNMDYRNATAYGANILTTPIDLQSGCIVPLDLQLGQPIRFQQWDGNDYHRIAEWTAGNKQRFAPYEPEWPYIYWSDGVLFQFHDDNYTGESIAVKEATGFEPPTLTSNPPLSGDIDTPLTYLVQAEGITPFWWSLFEFPTGARINHETGELLWKPSETGEYTFTIVVENDHGSAEQQFVYEVTVEDSPEDTGASNPTDTGNIEYTNDTAESSDSDDSELDDSTVDEVDKRGCSHPTQHTSYLMILILLLVRRRP